MKEILMVQYSNWHCLTPQQGQSFPSIVGREKDPPFFLPCSPYGSHYERRVPSFLTIAHNGTISKKGQSLFSAVSQVCLRTLHVACDGNADQMGFYMVTILPVLVHAQSMVSDELFNTSQGNTVFTAYLHG